TVLSLPLLEGEKIRVDGFTPKALKKLKGDKFGLKFLSIVLAKAMGRGATAPSNKRWNSGTGNSSGFILCMIIRKFVLESHNL
ncbi:MAG: hypothetical protein ACOC0R_04070, partial [Mariniphaga sp.]